MKWGTWFNGIGWIAPWPTQAETCSCFYLVNIHLFDLVVLDCIPPIFIAHTTGMTHFLDAFTFFEHMCSSAGGQNCITQPLVSSHLYVAVSCTGWERTAVLSQPVHETVTYRCDDTRGCVMQFWPPDDENTCSKHVEAWNKHILK